MIELLNLWHDMSNVPKLAVCVVLGLVLLMAGLWNKRHRLAAVWAGLLAVCLAVLALCGYSVYQWETPPRNLEHSLSALLFLNVAGVYLILSIWLLVSIFEKKKKT